MKHTLGITLIFLFIHAIALKGQEIPTQTENKGNHNLKTRYAPSQADANSPQDFQATDMDSIVRSKNDYERFLEIRFKDYTATDRAIHQGTEREMDQLVANVYRANPTGYQYHFLDYLHRGKRSGDARGLLKAYEINPKAIEIWPELMLHYELTQDLSKRNEIAKKIRNTEIYSTEVYKYQQNVIQSLSYEAFLLTYGDVDTYPFWIENLSYPENKINVINVSLCEKGKYRKSILKSYNLNSDVSYYTPNFFIQSLLEQNPDREFYFGLTLPPEIIKEFADQLYLTGLAYKFESKEFNNLPLLESNWVKFSKNYLLQKNIFTAEMNALNKNYLPLLITLSDYYDSMNEKGKKKEIENLIENISRRAGIENQVKQLRKG